MDSRKKNSLRVCLISPVPPPYGGIANWTAMILRYAASQPAIHISVVDTATRWRSPHDLTRWRRIVGGGLQLVRDLLLLLFQLLFRRPHVIHLTTSGQFGITRDIAIIHLAKIFGVPTVYHIRFGRIPDISERDTREWRRISSAMRHADTVVAIDIATKKTIRTHLPNIRVLRIPNCIDPSELPSNYHVGIDDEPLTNIRTLVYIGWVIPTKGIEELLVAWAGVKPLNWHLKIIGPRSAEFCKSLDWIPQEHVSFEGERDHDEAMIELQRADALVLPSYTEGFPNVILEAMTLRKPVVATRVGAIPEMLGDDSALLVDPHDSEQLKFAIANLVNHLTEYSVAADHAYRKAEKEYFIVPVFEALKGAWDSAANRMHTIREDS